MRCLPRMQMRRLVFRDRPRLAVIQISHSAAVGNRIMRLAASLIMALVISYGSSDGFAANLNEVLTEERPTSTESDPFDLTPKQQLEMEVTPDPVNVGTGSAGASTIGNRTDDGKTLRQAKSDLAEAEWELMRAHEAAAKAYHDLKLIPEAEIFRSIEAAAQESAQNLIVEFGLLALEREVWLKFGSAAAKKVGLVGAATQALTILKWIKKDILLVSGNIRSNWITLTMLWPAKQRYDAAWEVVWQLEHPEAVADAAPVRTVIAIIDSSGSMSENDPEGLRLAALELILAAARADTALGLVDFDSDATAIHQPLKLGAPGSDARRSLGAALSAIDADGGTDIGAALDQASAMVSASEGEVSFILLTDGKDQDWNGEAESVPQGVVVHTVALSENADRVGLTRLSQATGGTAAIARDSSDLQRIVSSLMGTAEDQELLLIADGSLRGGEIQEHTFHVLPGTVSMQSRLSWPGSDMDVTLRDPEGRVYMSADADANGYGVEGATYDVVHIGAPAPGTWSLDVEGVDVAAGGEPYTLQIAADDAPVATKWATLSPRPQADEPLAIAVEATSGVRWQKVAVKWWPPDGEMREMVLLPSAGGAQSGILQLFTPTIAGAYRMQVNLIGEAESGAQLSRAFDRTVEIVARGEGISPTQSVESLEVAEAPTARSMTDILRSLAPIEFLPEHSSGAPRSIDLDVRFELNSHTLTPEAMLQLDALGAALGATLLVAAQFEIAGHTDASGGADYNQRLSEHRAQAVVRYLNKTAGIDAVRMHAVGYGETRLKDSLSPRSALNRRVEVVAHYPSGADRTGTSTSILKGE
jgi:outer membrane protein OmpA-like peptidoglycan-associated protein